MTDQQEDSQVEDFLAEEDFPEVEYPEEEEDTPEEVEAHQEQDPWEEDGDHHPSKCRNLNKESWWEKHPPFMTGTGRTHNYSSTNGSCIGG